MHSFREDLVALKRSWHLFEANDTDQEVLMDGLLCCFCFLEIYPGVLHSIFFVAIILSIHRRCLFYSFRLGFLIVLNVYWFFARLFLDVILGCHPRLSSLSNFCNFFCGICNLAI